MAGPPKQSPDAARSRTHPVAGRKPLTGLVAVVADATRGAALDQLIQPARRRQDRGALLERPTCSDKLVARGYAVLWRRPAGFC